MNAYEVTFVELLLFVVVYWCHNIDWLLRMMNDVVHKLWDMSGDSFGEFGSDNARCWESCIMVYKLWSSFSVLCSGGVDREQVDNSNEELVKCYLWWW